MEYQDMLEAAERSHSRLMFLLSHPGTTLDELKEAYNIMVTNNKRAVIASVYPGAFKESEV